MSYCYNVSSYDLAGHESYPSASACRTLASDTEAPSTPQNLTADTLSSTSIALAWDASTDNAWVSEYRLYFDSIINEVTSPISTLTSAGNTYTHTGLTHSAGYCYQVTALDASGNESSASNYVCATTNVGYTVGGTVTGLGSSDKIRLRLNASYILDVDYDDQPNFHFSELLEDGDTYTVEILLEPDGLDCTLSNETGTINGAAVPNVYVDCAA